MDKKNTTIGVLLIIAAISCYYYSARYAPPVTAPAAVRQAVAQQMQSPPPASAAPSVPTLTAPPSGEPAFEAASAENSGSTVTQLENDFIRASFTDYGGAIRDVALKKYPAALGRSDPFVFNELHYAPMMAFLDFPGLDRSTRYKLVSKTDTEIVYRTQLDGKLEVTRRYVLEPNQVGSTDPYEIRAETTFRNLTSQADPPIKVSVALGTAAPVSALDYGRYLAAGYSDGKTPVLITRSKLEDSGGIFGFGAHPSVPSITSPGPFQWASVSNQFFAAILTPDKPGAGTVAHRVKLLTKLPDSDHNAYGIANAAQLDLPGIAPGETATLGGMLYVGPKEYRRLSNADVFKGNQDKIMQYGGWFISFFSEILITLMTWMHAIIPNWGFTIICTTLVLKLVFLPLTLVAARSSKRMQKIQPELKALKEKYKDNPQKQQQATMALFKEHKVNPMGGCLPMLITLPFFFGFYAMLQSTAELRFASFLWARDLSAPDTVGHFMGISINILPLLLGATSFMQMHLTPQPTVDKAQASMMKFTPLIFMMVCYNYSCALSVYSTTNGLFTIIQQIIINKTKDPAAAPAGAPAGAARRKPVKNVTPGKRK